MTGISPTRFLLELSAQAGIGITSVELFHIHLVPTWVLTCATLAALILVAPRWWQVFWSGLGKLFYRIGPASLWFFTAVGNKCTTLSMWPNWANKKLVRLRKKIGLFLLRPKSED